MKKRAVLLRSAVGVLLVLVPAMSASFSVFGQKGKGGGKPKDRFPAIWEFSGCGSGPCITSDGAPYEHGVDHVNADFVPAGNPILDLRSRKSSRSVLIQWDTCEPAGQGPVPETPKIRLNHSQLWDEDMILIEERFLGMAINQVAYSILAISFDPEDKSREGWAIRFSESQSADRVQVTRVRQDVWHVTSFYDNGTQAQARVGRVRNGAFQDLGPCPFQLDFTVTCEGCSPPPAP